MFKRKIRTLWHPESPGVIVEVLRSDFKHFFMDKEMAHLNEKIIRYKFNRCDKRRKNKKEKNTS